MILSDFLRAVAQLGDRRFRRVLWLGLALTLALLTATYGLLLGAIQVFAPDSITLPVIGEVDGLSALLSWASVLLMIGLSVFLMVPVASAFSGLFLDDVARAVEKRHYPHLPDVARVPIMDSVIDSINFVGFLVVVNALALFLFALAGPLIPVLFWALNGLLLGREYFQMVAIRRLGREGAAALRRRHRMQVWLAGSLMAAPLSLPVVNLFVPVLGAATFTHMFHRLNGSTRA